MDTIVYVDENLVGYVFAWCNMIKLSCIITVHFIDGCWRFIVICTKCTLSNYTNIIIILLILIIVCNSV